MNTIECVAEVGGLYGYRPLPPYEDATRYQDAARVLYKHTSGRHGTIVIVGGRYAKWIDDLTEDDIHMPIPARIDNP